VNWAKYQGEFVSVLITGKGGKEENYLGIVKLVDSDYMMLDTSKPNKVIDEITFRLTLINSIWIYKPKDTKRKSKKARLANRDKYGLGYSKKSKLLDRDSFDLGYSKQRTNYDVD